VEVPSLKNVIQISNQGSVPCAVLSNGTVDCWEDTGISDVTLTGENGTYHENVPTFGALEPVAGLSGVSQISENQNSICAVLADDTVKCWALPGVTGGNGPTFDSNTPTLISGLSGVTQVSVGTDFACALLTDGTVKCWGQNSYGDLGNGSSDPNYANVPMAVVELSKVTQISVGWFGACALLTGGTVKCWGSNEAGELGDGTTVNSSVPVSVNGLSPVKQISIGASTACALMTNGTLDTWGFYEGNNSGSTVTTAVSTSLPVEVTIG
jgi:alpha-tubulin suppressor-like RCC1 family protein